MIYEGYCSNLVFQREHWQRARHFNKEELLLTLLPFTRNVNQKRRKNCVWENAYWQVKITASIIVGLKKKKMIFEGCRSNLVFQ